MVRTGEAGQGEARIRRAVQSLVPGRYLLAVSGGRDSMVLLDACARWRSDVVGVATFDHGSGTAAADAVQLVLTECAERGVTSMAERNRVVGARTEAAWRTARREFLGRSARSLGATVVTAHTRDDQLETIVMRALRDSRKPGARGLAGMYATSAGGGVARPLLEVRRTDITGYAAARHVRFIDDPTNASRAHLRNRVRLDLLPALESASPGFGDEMLGIARRAAAWRASVEAVVDRLGMAEAPGPGTSRSFVVPVTALTGVSPAGLAVLWPAIAGRAGLALDWRGLERTVAFTGTSEPGGRIPLAGGWVVRRTPDTFVITAPGGREPLYL